MTASYSIRKFARDLGVVLVGTVLLFLGTESVALDVPPEFAALIGPFALVGYRMLRSRSSFLRSSDPQGE